MGLTTEKTEKTMADLQPMTDENRADYGKARAQAYTAATTLVRDAHLDEYNLHVKAEMAKRGYAWAPRPTGRDRALEQIRDLATKAGLGVDEVAAALVDGDVTVTSHGDTDE